MFDKIKVVPRNLLHSNENLRFFPFAQQKDSKSAFTLFYICNFKIARFLFVNENQK